MHHTLKKALQFYLVSGTGWIIDFTIFTSLTHFYAIPVLYANIISSIPSITLIFFVSTKKVFSENKTRFSTGVKYVIYIVYQAILLVLISLLAEFLFFVIMTNFLNTMPLLIEFAEPIIKIIITPITMVINFLFMQFLAEKL